ncbi:MAG: hypothetical protein Q9160_002001 [Pyrenula sp. 1 TL-2023]
MTKYVLLYALAIIFGIVVCDTNATNDPKPTASDFNFIAGKAGVGGFDVFLGPELQKAIDGTVKDKSKCQDPTKYDCYSDIQKLFPKDRVNLQRRFIGTVTLVGILAVTLISAIILGKAAEHFAPANKDIPANVHIPEYNVAQIGSATSASSLAVATAMDDGSPILMDTAQNEQFDQEPPYMADDPSGNGDVIIHLNKDLAASIQKTLDENRPGCLPKAKRDSSGLSHAKRVDPALVVSCVSAAIVAIYMSMPNGPGAQLVRGEMRGHAGRRPVDLNVQMGMRNAGRQLANIQREMGMAYFQHQQIQKMAAFLARQHDSLQRIGEDNRILKSDMDQSDQGMVKKSVCGKEFIHDIPRNFHHTFTIEEADTADGRWEGYAGYTFEFTWEDKPGLCVKDCIDIWGSFTHGSCKLFPINSHHSARLLTPIGVPDPHSMHTHGELDVQCGKAEYRIHPPDPNTCPVCDERIFGSPIFSCARFD